MSHNRFEPNYMVQYIENRIYLYNMKKKICIYKYAYLRRLCCLAGGIKFTENLSEYFSLTCP